jgi:hypothetical protein
MPWVQIVFGLFFMVNAFTAKYVRSTPMPGGYPKYQVPIATRVIFFLAGAVLFASGVVTLVGL